MIPGLSTVKLIGLALLVLAFAAMAVTIKIQHSNNLALKAQVVAVTAQRDQAIGVANDNAQTIRDVTADRDAAKADATQAHADFTKHKAAATIQIAKLQKEVADATVQNECPVAPSVLAALTGLRDVDAPAADGDGGAGQQTPGAGGPDGAVRGSSAVP